MKNQETEKEFTFNFTFDGRIFNVNLEKLRLILPKLNIDKINFKNDSEFEQCLKENHLLTEEFLDFISF